MHMFLPLIMNHFNRICPHVQVHTRRCDFHTIRDDLIRKDIDIGFTLSFSFPPGKDFTSCTIFRDRTYIALSSSHPLAAQSTLDIKDLRQEPLIMISRNESPEGYRYSLNMLKTEFGFTPVDVIEADNFESQFLYTASGMGFSLLDSSLSSYHSSNIRTFPLTEEPEDKVSAVWYSHNTNPNLQKFINVLNETDLRQKLTL